jgi:von Willebrand factor type A domain
MKTLKQIFKSRNILLAGLILILVFTGLNISADSNDEKKAIKIALLLDTSNSMDGLIEQAKSQLWTIVNELAGASCDGERPELQIALYEYGNDWLSAREGYIRQVTYLTKDLDLVSQKLFELRTNGGSEFCGQVINTSLDQLEWNNSNDDLKLIFIAGNEPFTQGGVNFHDACYRAKNKGVVVNTIFCGDFREGVQTSWKKGADITGGEYMSINQDCKTVFVASPYDDRIAKLNTRLNDTYVSYGSLGREKKQNQARQDANAGSISKVNAVKRSVSKASHVYKNESWDLVDAAEQEDFEITSVKEAELPVVMKGMNDKEKVEYVDTKKKEREKIQKEIIELNKKRETYVKKQQTESSENVLDDVMLKAIKTQAKSKNFKFEK